MTTAIKTDNWLYDEDELAEREQEVLELQSEADAARIMQDYRGLTNELGRIKARAQERIDEVKAWEEREARKVETRLLWMRGGLKAHLVNSDRRSLSLPDGTLKLRKKPLSIDFDDVDLFVQTNHGTGFVRVKTEYNPDRRAIVAHIKSGGEIPDGVQVLPEEDSFSIKLND